MQKIRKLVPYIAVVGIVAVGVLAITNKSAIYDWFRLHNYHPPATVAALATQTTMTPQAQHMFYLNHPEVQNKAAFNSSCPNNGGEQTIVLGCYHPHETGIFLYDVTNPQLNGVMQVTAAHETLHAIYERLTTKERNYVNGLLENYYQHDLSDQRLLDTIAAYKQTEPNDVVNEMHSIFGTEVANLPPALESYYSQYFTARAEVVNDATRYESEFTNLKNQVSQYDQQLATLKTQIDANENILDAQQQELNTERANLDALLQQQQYGQYNANVGPFNQKIQSYNNLVANTQSLINQYNTTLTQRNAVAVQSQQLYQAIDSRLSPQTEKSQ